MVEGNPGPQGSKRHVGNGRMIESSKKVRPWRDAVEAAARTAMQESGIAAPLTDPVHVIITFTMRRPSSHWGTGRNASTLRPSAPDYPTSRAVGDLDKLCRSTLDALTSARLIHDDSLVVGIQAVKVYSDGSRFNPTGARIEVTTVGCS